MKKLFCLLLSLLIFLNFGLDVFAKETIMLKPNTKNSAPIIGEFKYNFEHAIQIHRKEKLADEYYNAKISGNIQKASSALTAFKSLNTAPNTLASFTPLVHSPMRYSSSYHLPIMQIPQDRNFYCGYASIKSLLNFAGIYKSQTQIAREVYRTNASCPWYLSHGNSLNQFPVPNYLTNQIGYFYEPFPYGVAGTVSISANDIKPKVVSTIDSDHGLVACGTSDPDENSLSHLPKYPTNASITHWIVINGYYNNGDMITIADPAKSPAVSWSGNITAYYSISAEKLAAFCKARGLVW